MTRVEHLRKLEMDARSKARALIRKKRFSSDDKKDCERYEKLANIYADMAKWEGRDG